MYVVFKLEYQSHILSRPSFSCKGN